MLILPSKKYRPKGLEELDKECSALGYAMQAGQPELVKAVSTFPHPCICRSSPREQACVERASEVC